ncbi:virulence RhuM family protein [Aliarcobacter cryaerophilus]|uniref:Virulence RhuM family protein n=2 Tax=unclassified Arcobacter TaxID=2593671 RepID=A0AA96CZK6_9BACT|nr:virulence RhuM family protein [Arcobacter sp. AZ-2023]WPD10141.1 virulence RhuM family protein [Arcobacter sp. DSM 115954]WNL14972.1 virulence RhuM family protein [Arcobacter sp. AZ-2023]WNL19145.1 virulence RhuM family protein [Arcobacter sp. AZ-2023]WNL21284.1 virulence RhuM family protein [Arcobacter sp. AZ-2023]
MDKQIQLSSVENISNFVIFKIDKSKVNIDVLFKNETLWLTQKQIAELFEVNVPAISKHLKNIFETKELEEESVISKMETTASDGKKYKTNFYNLKVITAVGYRVNSHRATQFRKWATTILEEYIIKGFAMDDERLKNIHHFGKDYFDEQLDRIREIRLSERRFYQKITDIYSLSADYDKEADITKDFYATVQNKMHWAICGKTAAEIIYSEADAQKIYMGLKTWKNAPDGKILKSDVTVAKNYLNKEHIEQLKRIVSAYLDLAEDRAKRGIVMNMNDWILFLDKFLALSDYPILLDSGKISALEAKLKAHTEFEKYRVVQDKEYLSDFDKLLLEMEIK